MGRAERRRAQKKERKENNATYNLTKAQLDYAIEKGIKSKLEGMREKITNDAVNTAMMLTLILPFKVLLEEYWKDEEEKLSAFAESVINLYSKWQDGEIDISEYKKELWKYGGIKIEEESYICKEGETDV